MSAATVADHGIRLIATGVTVSLGGRAVLDDVDAAVEPGRVLAIIGPNGAGKSTLLSVLAGDVRPTTGSVELGGRDLSAIKDTEQARLRAVLTQSVDVGFPFTVRQVVEMGRMPWRRVAADLDESRIATALADTGMTAFADRPLPQLSGGERARAQLARVLAQDTPVVLLDEPTAALDLQHQEAVLRLARRAAGRGRAVAVVLHDLDLAASYADHVLLLEQGRVAASGSPAHVLTAARLSGVYGVDVEVFDHPRTGAPIVRPVREHPDAAAGSARPDDTPPVA